MFPIDVDFAFSMSAMAVDQIKQIMDLLMEESVNKKGLMFSTIQGSDLSEYLPPLMEEKFLRSLYHLHEPHLWGPPCFIMKSDQETCRLEYMFPDQGMDLDPRFSMEMELSQDEIRRLVSRLISLGLVRVVDSS